MPPRPSRQPETGPQFASPTGRVLGRHAALLSDPKVRSWWEAKSLRSRLSADTYLRQFGYLLERLQLTPGGAATLASSNPDRLRDLLIRDAAKLKREGRLDSYIGKFSEGLKSYFRFQRVSFDGFPPLSPIKGESLSKERVPTPEELAPILERLSLRSRVCALFMAHSGLRPGVLGSYQAEGGLTLGDLPDLELDSLHFKEQPFVVRVPAALSKTRVSYVTFGSAQLATVLLAYLGERRESDETLTPSSPVVSVRSTRGVAERRRAEPRYARGFIVTKAVVEEIHDALKEAAPKDTRWRPYVLRSYASTRLLMAEGAGKVTRDLREAMLGHDTGVAGRYSVGKRWGDDLLKEARAAYKRCEPFLSTVPTKSEADAGVNKVLKALLVAQGMPEDEVEKLDLTEKSEDELKQIFGKFLSAVSTPPAERAVPVDAVPKMLDEGWLYVAPLNGALAIVRSPSQRSGVQPSPRPPPPPPYTRWFPTRR